MVHHGYVLYNIISKTKNDCNMPYGGITFFNENLFFFACFDETIGTLVDNDEGGHGNNEPMAKGSENDEREGLKMTKPRTKICRHRRY